jgi:radical SAM protein with 4Fe4S-binding SPASM domain
MQHKVSIRHIIYEVTQECNLTCRYCYNYWRREHEQIRVSDFRDNKRAIRKLLKTVDFEHITFTGGEPFCADGLAELILDCRMKGKSVNVISNGTRGTCKDYLTLKKLGVGLLEFPLHSDNATVHDTLTTVPGCFEKVVDSIRYCIQSGLDVCTVVVLTKENIESLEATLTFAQSLGVKRVMLARFNIGGRGIANADPLMPSAEQLKKAFTVAHECLKKNSLHISANVCLPECIICPEEFPGLYISRCSADVNRRPLTINSFGEIRVCNHSPVTIGSIRDSSIDSVFNSKYIKQWYQPPDYCSNCTRWQTCGGGCRAASEQLGYSPEQVDPIVTTMKSAY